MHQTTPNSEQGHFGLFRHSLAPNYTIAIGRDSGLFLLTGDAPPCVMQAHSLRIVASTRSRVLVPMALRVWCAYLRAVGRHAGWHDALAVGVLTLGACSLPARAGSVVQCSSGGGMASRGGRVFIT